MPSASAVRSGELSYREILLFAAPILLAMVVQNIMGIVDNALVGRIGTEALAAYGLGFFILFIHAAPLMGLATAVQALTARSVGSGERDRAAFALNSALLASVGLGIALALGASLYTDAFVSVMTKDPRVRELAAQYLRMRFLGLFAIGVTHSFRGYWNGLGRPNVFLGIMSFSYGTNAVLSYGLLFGRLGLPEMGLAGAALGSTLATALAAALNFAYAFAQTRDLGFHRSYFGRGIWRGLLVQSIPSGAQQLLFALGYAVFFGIIGRLGSGELAAANVLVAISLFLIYPGMAMGMTAATYVARALGARDPKGSRAAARKVALLSVLLFAGISLPLLLARDGLLGLFIHDPAVRELARIPLVLFLGTLALEALGQVYTFAFFGAGRPKVILVATVTIQWIGILPLCYFLGADLTRIWAIQVGLRCVQALALAAYWETTGES